MRQKTAEAADKSGTVRAPKTRRTTIAEIAVQAGVSEPTVSKVLNNRSDVAPDTRAQVQLLLEESGYTRRPRRQVHRGGLVDLVITDLTTPWASEILRGAEEEAHRQGRALVITATHDRNADPRNWMKSLSSRRSDGVVLVLSRLEESAMKQLAALTIPLILIDPVGGSDPVIPTVGATNWAGGLTATEHLIELGHRRIGIITGPADVVCSGERLDGYRAALGRAGIPVDETLIRYGDFRAEGGRAATASLLDLDDPPTAIFAGSDQHAGGVYREAHARGLRIPDDLSVVGFDDVQLCEWLTPQLTTIRQPLAEMSRLATRAVLDKLPGGTPGVPQHLELATALVLRDSTAAPRA